MYAYIIRYSPRDIKRYKEKQKNNYSLTQKKRRQ